MAKSKAEFIPLSDNIGVEARGVDIKNMDEETFKDVYQAWLDHSGVLLIRRQELDCPAILEFSKRFGEIDMPRKTRIDNDPWIPQFPQFIRITDLKDESGDELGALGNGEAFWHSDMTYLDEVPRASILYACEVPDNGTPWSLSTPVSHFRLIMLSTVITSLIRPPLIVTNPRSPWMAI